MMKNALGCNVGLKLAGESILELIDEFYHICDSSDCPECLYCDWETEEELEDMGIDLLRCFAYYISVNFGIDLQEYYSRKGGNA